ncbi:MAG: biofilm PGA synthesis protein PgaB, partial [Firmicutes bacterium]|nr:biofilm PGA synthesis protein PgaB [Bacillota bacterium]
FAAFFLPFAAHSVLSAAQPKVIRVGVFKGLGGDPECISDAMEALKIDAEIRPEIVTAAQILRGRLDHLDALVLPGGGGARQMGNLGDLGQRKVLAFVQEQGRGVVGLCAGAYMLSDTPGYPCFYLGGFEAIDRNHDERGNGMVRFTFTPHTFEVFPEFKGVTEGHMQYFEGPVLIPVPGTEAVAMAVMESDVHLKPGAPANMTNGKTFLAWSAAGKGRVFMAVGHPENTPGYRWMLPRMVRWTLRKPLVSYGSNVVMVRRNQAESLFDAQLKAKERACFNELLEPPTKGGAQKKLAAIATLLEIRSWGAKERLEGALRDQEGAVRLAAAQALVDLEHTAATQDVKAAADTESDSLIKAKLI